MKKGIHYWALPQTLNLKEKMEFAKRLGFDGVELVIVEHGELPPDCGEEELKAVWKAAQDAQIEIVALSSSLNWKCSVTSANEGIRKKAKDLLLRQLYMAKAIDAGVILALPGFVEVDFVSDQLHPLISIPGERDYHPGLEIVDYKTAYDRSLQAFRELAPVAESLGVIIGIENIWNHFLLSPLEMRNFIDEIGSDWVQIYFDVGNVMPWGRPEQWIRILDFRIKRIHMKDFRKGCTSVNGFVNLLSGDIDFLEVMKALCEIGYDGWMTAEVNEKQDFPEFAARNSAMVFEYLLLERSCKDV